MSGWVLMPRCAAYHDTHVRGIKGCCRIECDEIWSFVHAKQRSMT